MNFAELVQQIVEEARRKAGSGPALALELERAGVGPENGRYSESGISNWTKGRTMPPADVLLAAAVIGGVSLDARLAHTAVEAESGRPDAAEAIEQLRGEVRELQRQHGRLQTLLMDLYSRTGQPYPHERSGEERPTRRAVGA